MEFHEIADLFPMMQPNELQDLVDDIKQNGLIEPIVLYEDKILDGRNRFLACGEAGVKPHYEYYKGDQPVSYVVSKNLHRRHLTGSQKAGVGWKLKDILMKEAKIRQEATQFGGGGINSTTEIKGMARDLAGKAVGISGRYIDEFGKIEQEAPEYVEPIMKGKMTITKAKREIRRKNLVG